MSIMAYESKLRRDENGNLIFEKEDFEEFKRNFLKRREESAPYRERLRKSQEVYRETGEITFTV